MRPKTVHCQPLDPPSDGEAPGCGPDGRFVSAWHVVSTLDAASRWRTLALALELATPLDGQGERTPEGMQLTEIRWWGRVQAGDVLQVHARAAVLPLPQYAGLQPKLLWTVNQLGRCVFSCLIVLPSTPRPAPARPGALD